MLKLLIWIMKEKHSVEGRHKQYMNTKDEYFIAFTNGQLNAYQAVVERIDIGTREVRG